MITRLTQLVGIGAAHADRIRKYLGRGNESRAIEAIELDPYLLTTVPRVGFRIADKIARHHYGESQNSLRRHTMGNQHILEHDGSMNERDFEAARQKLDLFGADHKHAGVELEHGRVWLPEVLQADVAFAEWTADLPLGHESTVRLHVTPEIDALLRGLDPTQQRAALSIVAGSSSISAMTGDAGTGKTHVIATGCNVARHLGLKVCVMAFAGKAADRIRQALDAAGAIADSGTIHRLLGYTGTGFKPERLPYDVVIVDECSMIPTILLWEVVKHLRSGARLVLVGDPGQLPPVGYGQPFTDLITLGVPRVHLERNYRQAEQLDIVKFAGGIRAGRECAARSVELHVARDLSEVLNDLLAEKALQEGESVEAFGQRASEWQVITWRNEDADEFNAGIQEAVNPWGFPLFTYRPWGGEQVEVRAGDKVMVRANDYDYGVFNGQLGVALKTDTVELVREREALTLEDFAVADPDGMVRERITKLCVIVRIGADTIAIPLEEAADLLKLGYAITVHKAQGSDWDHVIVYQRGPVSFDAQRWWYTSVTRARSRLTVAYEAKVKGDADQARSLFWLNASRGAQDGPSIFVGRVKKVLATRSQKQLLLSSEASAHLSPEEVRQRTQGWLGQ
ncbi:AAA family ATPase [Deinococcus peraridilitoris]|uniref:ATP-dependent exoDNAse (Exonuclease V), alpha subunit/helicase superfamily I member n=1 Tax=Deinococcus peraridilitoris (strain DSM 19664 / LMG 22246 / CIP 109416 / KR-200) TaxID=937777 RepID=K9ZWT8_DEIPD|nr:AAA family ATPase [Deinococcus peraridilitoris]AFZ66093.1 ATP-dependent exoDNAse (exonuclease V), alpha subunit/helicase superfamily I member [Deinococcus peraridilitoris DSM 19664]